MVIEGLVYVRLVWAWVSGRAGYANVYFDCFGLLANDRAFDSIMF